MDENQILIKIATDISAALAGFTETTQQLANIVQQMLELQQASETSGESVGNVAAQMGELQSTSEGTGEEIGKVGEAVAQVGESSVQTEEETKSLWETLVEGMTSAETGAVAMGKQLSDAFDTAKEGLKGLITGFPDMVSKVAEAGDEMQTLSNRLNVSVENLSELKFIAGQSGASMEGMARAMQGLGGTLSDSSSKGAKAIQGLGLSLSDLKAQDPKEAFLGIIQTIHDTVPAADQGAKAMEIFGARFRSNTMLVKENVEELHESFVHLGGGMTTEMAKAGDDFSDNWKKIEQVQENFKMHVTSYVLGPINEVLKIMPNLGGAMLTVGQSVMGTAKSFLPLIANISTISGVGGLKGLIAGFKAWRDESKLLMPVLRSIGTSMMSWPVVLITGAVIALSVAIYEWMGGLEGITKALAPVIQLTKDLWTIIEKLAQVIWANVSKKGVAGSALAEFGQMFVDLWNWVKNFFTGLFEYVHQLPIIGHLLDPIIAYFKIWKASIQMVYEAFVWLVDKVKPIIMPFIDAIVGRLEKVFGMLKTAAGWLGTAFTGMVNGAHEVAEAIRAEEGAAKSATEALKDHGKAVAAVKSEMDNLMGSVSKTNEIYKGFSATTRKQIDDALKAGKTNKDIAEAMHTDLAKSMGAAAPSVEELSGAIDILKKSLDDAKHAAAESPWGKLQKEGKDLAQALKDAAAAGTPAAVTMEEYGKKASEAVKHAAGLKDGMKLVDAATQKLAADWEAAQLAEKMAKLNEKATELATTFNEKMTAGASAAAAATKGMLDEMRISMMSESDAKLARIDLEEEKQIASLDAQNVAWNKAFNDRVEGERKLAAEALKTAEANAGPGGVSQAQRDKIEADKQAAIAAAEVQLNIARGATYAEIAMAKTAAEEKRKIAAMATGDFQKDAQLRGLTTKAMYQKEATIQKERLAFMQKNRTEFSAWEIEQQQKTVDQAVIVAEDGMERQAQNHGLKTKEMLEAEASAQQSWLQTMMANRKTFTDAQIAAQKEIVQQAREAAGHMKVEWKGAFDNLAQSFEQLANISQGTFGGMVKNIGTVVGSISTMSTGMEAAFGKKGAFGGDGFKNISSAFSTAKGDAGGIGGIIKGIGGSIPMIGAAISGAIAVAGLAIKGVKKLWDHFTNTEGEKTAKEVGKNFGVTITEEAGDAIAKSAKELFHGDRFTAEIYSMKTIVDTAGGITEKNFKQMADRLGEVFHLIDDGKMTAAQATKVLSENFGAFADHVIKTGKIATKEFTDIIKLQQQYGTTSKEITDFVAGQTTRLGAALGKLMGPLTKNVNAYTEAQKAAKEATEKLQKAKDSGDDTAELQADADKLNKTLADTKKELEGDSAGMARFERLTVAGFNAAIKNGVSYLDAIESMGPALDALVGAHEALGTKGSAAIQELLKFREVADKNKELVESAGSLNEIMLALSNTGSLTADTMADLQAQGMDTFTKLTTAGFTEGQSLQQMKGFLEGVRDSHKELGIPIDENTQKLINQAEKEGILSKEQLSTNDLLQQGLGAVIEALGGKLPAAWEAAAKKAKGSTEEINTSINTNVVAPAQKASDTLDKTNWKGYASKAEYAAKIAADKLGGTAGAAENVDAKLAATDWDAWERAAVEAANNAKTAIDGVSLGTSPGGIKEIPIKIAEAIKAFREFEKRGVGSADEVKQAIDDMQLGKVRTVQMAAAHAALDSEVTVRDEHAAQLDETLKAMQEQAQAPPINFAFDVSAISADGMKQAVEQQILPLIVGAVDRNNRGSLTKFRQLINPKTK